MRAYMRNASRCACTADGTPALRKQSGGFGHSATRHSQDAVLPDYGRLPAGFATSRGCEDQEGRNVSRNIEGVDIEVRRPVQTIK